MKKLMMVALMALLLMGCTSASKNVISLEEAQEIALKEIEGKVLKAKEDEDDGVSYYDFTIITDSEKYEVEVDANSGAVLKVEKDDDYVGTTTNTTPTDNQTTPNTNENQSNTNNNPQATITAEKAQEIAMNRVGGGYLVKCELDHDDGVLKYEIEIINANKEYDLEINANTGDIIKFEEDYED